MKETDIENLLDSYLKGTCTPAEKTQMERWFDQLSDAGTFVKDAFDSDATMQRMKEKIDKQIPPGKSFRISWKLRVDASVIFISSAAIYGCAIPQFISTFDVEDARYQRNWIKGQQYTSAGEMLYVAQGDFAGKPLSFINELPGLEKGESVDGFRLGKFEVKMGASNRLSNDYPLFRYAEVLMMRAESLLRSGRQDEAATVVTEIRQRSFTTDPAKAVVTGARLMAGSVYQYGLKDAVNNQFSNEGGADIQYGRFLDELGWEFDQEGHRRTDMIRFGAFTKKSWLSHAATNNNNRTLFPIPRTEIQKNNNLTQNNGY